MTVVPGIDHALGSAISAVTSLYNTRELIRANQEGRRETHAFQARLAGERFAHEREMVGLRFTHDLQLDSIRAKRQHELVHLEGERDKRLAQEARRLTSLYESYPFEEGPGHLRESLSLMAPDLSTLPLLLLVPRPDGTGEGRWTGMRHAIISSLRRELADDGLVFLPESMRALTQWPHANLYWYDLCGIPTLIAKVAYSGHTLDLSLGGCHLHTNGRSEPLRSVYRHRLIGPDEVTPEMFSALQDTSVADARVMGGTEKADRDWWPVELAARAVTAVVAAAVDTYYLGSQIRYPQRFDAVATHAALPGRAAWPVDLGVPLAQVADPAFHLLHVANRHAARGETGSALDAIRLSLALLVDVDAAYLTGVPYPPLAVSGRVAVQADDLYRALLDNVIDLTRERCLATGTPDQVAEIDRIAVAVHE